VAMAVLILRSKKKKSSFSRAWLFHVMQLMKLINLIGHTKTAVSPTVSYKEKSFKKKVTINFWRSLYKPITSCTATYRCTRFNKELILMAMLNANKK
jgi:hypothetical protein